MRQEIANAVALIRSTRNGDRDEMKRTIDQGITECGFGFVGGLAAVAATLLDQLERSTGREASAWLDDVLRDGQAAGNRAGARQGVAVT